MIKQSRFIRPTEQEEAQLRAMLKIRRSPPQPRSRDRLVRRNVVFTAADERAFLRLLRSAWPRFFILGERRSSGRFRWEVLPDFSDAYTALGCLPESDAEPASYITRDGKLAREPRLAFQYWRRLYGSASDREDFSSAGVPEGLIQGVYEIDDAEHGKFLRKVPRLIAKMATNQLKTVDPETGEVHFPRWPGPWCGFDALRWCRENPRRVLGGCYQPMDGWEIPESPWYD